MGQDTPHLTTLLCAVVDGAEVSEIPIVSKLVLNLIEQVLGCPLNSVLED
jgi:hypothetical protein